MKELTEEQKKEVDHMVECMKKIVLPDLPKKRKPNRKQERLI